MSTWAVLPVKSFARAKSRLSNALDLAARRALARELFEGALRACDSSSALDGVIVLTDGTDVERICAAHGVPVLRDDPHEPLAHNIDRALENVRGRGAALALVLMADLPTVNGAALTELVGRAGPGALALAPDAARRGTNALVVPLASGYRTCFGHPDSFMRHHDRAASHGLRACAVIQPRLAYDIDRPVDLARVAARSSRARRVSSR